jgi:small-conductance mechanosensitive channel
MSPELFAAVFCLGMFCGVFIIFMGLRQRSQQLEMHHRERMAMIERGQIPLEQPSLHYHDKRPAAGSAARSSRSMSIGIIIVGLGLALMIIIGIAADSPEVGVGVGGAIAIIGAAFIALSLVARPQVPPPSDDRP